MSQAGGCRESAVKEPQLDELAQRLLAADLAKIIKRALACGRENRPFTDADLRRALTVIGTKRIQRRVPERRSVRPLAVRPPAVQPPGVLAPSGKSPNGNQTEPVTGTHRIAQSKLRNTA